MQLLGAIVWGLPQNDRRLGAIEQRLGRLETRIDSVDVALASLHSQLRTYGAGDGIRTRDINLGKVALYQLSYSRVLGGLKDILRRTCCEVNSQPCNIYSLARNRVYFERCKVV